MRKYYLLHFGAFLLFLNWLQKIGGEVRLAVGAGDVVAFAYDIYTTTNMNKVVLGGTLTVHHSAPVKEWVEANKEHITLFHLPSYSPERNPDEYLNGDLKSELGRKAPPMDQNHLEKNLIGSMRRLSKSPQRVASYFDHPAVAYAKAT
jgi:hypothetical protein